MATRERPDIIRRRPDGLTLRPAAEHDIAFVAAIEKRSFSDPWPARAFRSLLHHPRVRFVVAVNDRTGELLGYVVAWFIIDEAEVANLAVAAEARGRQIGSALLDFTLASAAREGVRSVYLEVRDSNAAARALYGSRGFEEVGRRRSYYRAPSEDAIMMRATLGEHP